MSLLDSWLEARLSRPRGLARHTLVLARTRGAAASVRRYVARRGAWPALDIVTPRSLAMQLYTGNSTPVSPVPSGAMTDLIGERPGLLSLARRHARTAALRGLVIPDDTDLPVWLREWTQAGVGHDDDTAALSHLLGAAARGGLTLSSSHRYHRVVSVGFDVAPAAVRPWDAALLERLHAGRLPPEARPGRATASTVRALGVPDVIAAARVAVREVCLEPADDALVLVSDEATAERAHAALVRNGIPSAWRGKTALHSHTLASVLRRLTPWFSGDPDPVVSNRDLAFVFAHPQLGQRLPEPAHAWLLARSSKSRLGDRERIEVIEKAGMLQAPLSRWIRALEARDDRGFRLSVRLRILQACVRAEHLADAFGEELDDDWSDFDDLVQELLGDDAFSTEVPRVGSLAALRRFLLANGVVHRDDAATLAILGSLRDHAADPATSAHMKQVLAGAVDPREVADGVEICTYEDYDGRVSSALILLDVHSGGLTRRPTPDPFLSERELAALGVPAGRALVQLRLDQLQLAVSRSKRALAVVSERDAGGRAVVPPVQLQLQLSRLECPSYGIGLPNLPESRCLGGLTLVEGTTPVDPPAGEAALVAHCAQATAEWFRQGRAQGLPARSSPRRGTHTLLDLLEQRTQPPPWVGRYLGQTVGVDEATLPDRAWSTSALFRPLTHCLYQAFGKAVLGLRERPEVSDELDPREIGQAVHLALEQTAPWLERRPTTGIEQVRAEFLERLLPASAHAFREQAESVAGVSEARRSSARGLAERWAAHWPEWVVGRIRRVAQVIDTRVVRDFVEQHPALHAALERLEEVGDALGSIPWAARDWLIWAAGQAARGHDPSQFSDYVLLRVSDRSEMPVNWAPILRRFVSDPSFDRLVQALRSAHRNAGVLFGPIDAEIPELPFGREPAREVMRQEQSLGSIHAPEVSLLLGEERISVQGVIDRVSVVAAEGGLLLEILDYKTTGYPPSKQGIQRGLHSLKTPQLVLYALALRQMLRESPVPLLAGSRVAALGYDHVRATINERRQPIPAPIPVLVDDGWLDAAANTLGELLARGRKGDWALSPRKDTCPQLSGWSHDHCPLARSCRLRGLPSEGSS